MKDKHLLIDSMRITVHVTKTWGSIWIMSEQCDNVIPTLYWFSSPTRSVNVLVISCNAYIHILAVFECWFIKMAWPKKKKVKITPTQYPPLQTTNHLMQTSQLQPSDSHPIFTPFSTHSQATEIMAQSGPTISFFLSTKIRQLLTSRKLPC